MFDFLYRHNISKKFNYSCVQIVGRMYNQSSHEHVIQVNNGIVACVLFFV